MFCDDCVVSAIKQNHPHDLFPLAARKQFKMFNLWGNISQDDYRSDGNTKRTEHEGAAKYFV